MAFIVFEGLDASGKSTLIQGVQQELIRRGFDPLVTREPGGTPLAEEIRELLLKKGEDAPCARAEVLLYEAGRAQHVERVIRPALADRRWVLCDRFSASTVAFQVHGRGESEKDIHWLNRYATGGIEPDLTVFLDISVEMSQKRLKLRESKTCQKTDRFEDEKQSFHEKVRQGYLAQAKQESWLCLDAVHPPDQLLKELMARFVEKKWLES